jgi:hypothetical protein
VWRLGSCWWKEYDVYIEPGSSKVLVRAGLQPC